MDRAYVLPLQDCGLDMKSKFGQKGVNLAEMKRMGLPVPDGFLISAEACPIFQNKNHPEYGPLLSAIHDQVDRLETRAGHTLHGDSSRIALAVRSSGIVSMPGILDSQFDIKTMLHLQNAISAVFQSWYSPKAQCYREYYKIPDNTGLGVIVQIQVNGDTGQNSGTGVLFTRNPSTGEKTVTGEFLVNARGQDLVSGTRTPVNITAMQEAFPNEYRQLLDIAGQLEQHFKDMQDIEFTIEHHRLYILQTRAGKRTPNARVKIASDLCDEGLISQEEAFRIMIPKDRNMTNSTRLHMGKTAKLMPIAIGLPASPGAVSGRIALDETTIQSYKNDAYPVIFITKLTDTEHIKSMQLADAILTQHGGITSHAAVLARAMNKPCITGCTDIEIRDDTVKIGHKIYHNGDWISIDGSAGRIYDGYIPVCQD